MSKTLFILIAFFILSTQLYAQTSALDSIAGKYRYWLTGGDDIVYARPEINECYKSILSAGRRAKNLRGYNLDTPGSIWNLTVTADRLGYSGLVEQKLIQLVMLYQVKGPLLSPNPDYHSSTLKDTILRIFDYLKAKGVNDTTNFNMYVVPAFEALEIYNSVALRSWPYAAAIFMMKQELITAAKFNHHMAALNNLTHFISPDNPDYKFTYPGFNTDVIRSTVPQRLCYLLAQDDTVSTRVRDMIFLKRFINNALLISNGWSDCIKPDFIAYHHRGAYANSYGISALKAASELYLLLNGTTYALSDTAADNIKNALMAYPKFSADFTMPRAIAGRFPGNVNSSDLLRPALAYTYLSDTLAHKITGREFKRLWGISASANLSLQRSINKLGAMQYMLAVLDAGIMPADKLHGGQYSFPYAGLSVHKYNGWQISAKGTSKHIWHYENSASENLFGQYTSAGALELLTSGKPIVPDSNGLSFSGWDWAHIPGTTATQLPFSIMATSAMRQMNSKDFLAHAALDSNGVFALDYKDTNSATAMTALKTVFFFGNKVLCLGTNIRDKDGAYPIHTTLFQTSFNTAVNKSLVNGDTVSGNTYVYSRKGGGFWATDAIGNGYVVPASAVNTDSIHVQRLSQTTPNQSNTAKASGDFAKAYIDHGVAPAASAYRYAIYLQGGGNTRGLADSFDYYFNIIKQDSQAHVVQYVPDSVFNYVVFDTALRFTADAVLQVDKPSVIMTRKGNSGKRLTVSLTNPNLGLLSPGSATSYRQIGRTPALLYKIPLTDVVTLSLRGTWDPEIPAGNVTVTHRGANTELAFSTINGKTIETTLVTSVPLSLAFETLKLQSSNCRNELQWQFAQQEPLKGFSLERSSDAQNWQQIALLQPAVARYTDESAGIYFYRIVALQISGHKVYSNVLTGSTADCPQETAIIYPNPVTGKVTVLLHEPVRTAFVVSDMNGRVYDVKGVYGTDNIVLDLFPLDAGLYFIKINGAVHKIIKR